MFEYEFDGPIEDSNKPIMLVREGKCHFVVLEIENCISKAGNKQLKVKLKVTDDHRTSNILFVYIPALASFKKKLTGFLSGCGKAHLYQPSGRFDEQNLVGDTGACHIKHKCHEEHGNQAEVKFFYDKTDKSAPHHEQQAKSASAGYAEAEVDLDEIPF